MGSFIGRQTTLLTRQTRDCLGLSLAFPIYRRIKCRFVFHVIANVGLCVFYVVCRFVCVLLGIHANQRTCHGAALVFFTIFKEEEKLP